MKRIVVCVILALSLAAAGSWCFFYSDDTAKNILEELEETERLYSSGDTEEAAAASARAKDKWNGFTEIRILSVDNEHEMEITMSMSRLVSLIESENEEAMVEWAAVKELVEGYKREISPFVLNVI